LTFTAGTDIDVAQVQVQNKLQQAMSRCRNRCKAEGVTVTKGGNGLPDDCRLGTSDDPSVYR
jgi:HAE1 family hydrophobic/amphiphilic exporter-1